MANDINGVVLVGRLTKDAEVKDFQSSSVISFSLAVGHRVKKDSEWKEETDFFECRYWSKNASGIRQYLAKGRQVAIEGALRQERWEKDGQKNSRVVVLVSNLEFVGSEAKGSQNSNDSVQTQSYASQMSFNDADIPF